MEQGDTDLPPVPDAAGPIVEAITDLGMVHSSGMGLQPLPYTEIAAAAPWADQQERRLIREMSRAYLAGRALGENPLGRPPWEG